jgi:hypothetical protein
MEPSDYYDAPINKVLYFIRSVGLIKGNQNEKHNRSLKVACKGRIIMAYPLCIHSFIHSNNMYHLDNNDLIGATLTSMTQ